VKCTTSETDYILFVITLLELLAAKHERNKQAFTLLTMKFKYTHEKCLEIDLYFTRKNKWILHQRVLFVCCW